MIWSHLFEDRLSDWNDLRKYCQDLPLRDCLLAVNDWWMNAPLSTQHIAWEDWDEWPNPWDLLSDNTWCELTRSIGIVYTLGLLFRDDIESVYIIDSNEGIVVEVLSAKYFLGYCYSDLNAIDIQDIVVDRRINAKNLKYYKNY
jgi:hypothetical protein